MFSLLTNVQIVYSVRCCKNKKRPRTQRDVFKLRLLSNQESKTQRLFIVRNDKEKQEIITGETSNDTSIYKTVELSNCGNSNDIFNIINICNFQKDKNALRMRTFSVTMELS